MFGKKKRLKGIGNGSFSRAFLLPNGQVAKVMKWSVFGTFGMDELQKKYSTMLTAGERDLIASNTVAGINHLRGQLPLIQEALNAAQTGMAVRLEIPPTTLAPGHSGVIMQPNLGRTGVEFNYIEPREFQMQLLDVIRTIVELASEHIQGKSYILDISCENFRVVQGRRSCTLIWFDPIIGMTIEQFERLESLIGTGRSGGLSA